MSNPSDIPGGLADRNFHAVLPISDGVVTIRAMSDGDAEAYAAGTNDALVKHFAHLPLENYTPQIVRDMLQGATADGLPRRPRAPSFRGPWPPPLIASTR